MTKEELKDYYKIINIDKVNGDITKIDLYHAEGDNNRHIRLLFAYNKLYYTGDMGTYVFGNFVYNIKTFFRGSEIEPGYWSEKCEASSQPLLNELVDCDEVKEEVLKYILEDNLADEYYEIIDDVFWDSDSNYIRMLDSLIGMFDELNYEDSYDHASLIISKCRHFNERYLYACEVIQWIENEYFGGENCQNS